MLSHQQIHASSPNTRTTKDELANDNQRLLYWLLECYRTLTRDPSYEDGYTDNEMCAHLVSVLANRGLDPNSTAGQLFLTSYEKKLDQERF
jgi:hypothetical protein